MDQLTTFLRVRSVPHRSRSGHSHTVHHQTDACRMRQHPAKPQSGGHTISSSLGWPLKQTSALLPDSDLQEAIESAQNQPGR